MLFLTRRALRDNILSQGSSHPEPWVLGTADLPRPRAIGMLPLDILVVTLDRSADRIAPDLVGYFEESRFVARATRGMDHETETPEFIPLIKRSRSVMYVAAAYRLPERVCYAWQLGCCRGAERPVCLLPVFSGRFGPDHYTPTGLWQDLPVVGAARTVGEADYSLWVLRSETRSDSDNTINFDYWLRNRFKFVRSK